MGFHKPCFTFSFLGDSAGLFPHVPLSLLTHMWNLQLNATWLPNVLLMWFGRIIVVFILLTSIMLSWLCDINGDVQREMYRMVLAPILLLQDLSYIVIGRRPKRNAGTIGSFGLTILSLMLYGVLGCLVLKLWPFHHYWRRDFIPLSTVPLNCLSWLTSIMNWRSFWQR